MNFEQLMFSDMHKAYCVVLSKDSLGFNLINTSHNKSTNPGTC